MKTNLNETIARALKQNSTLEEREICQDSPCAVLTPEEIAAVWNAMPASVDADALQAYDGLVQKIRAQNVQFTSSCRMFFESASESMHSLWPKIPLSDTPAEALSDFAADVLSQYDDLKNHLRENNTNARFSITLVRGDESSEMVMMFGDAEALEQSDSSQIRLVEHDAQTPLSVNLDSKQRPVIEKTEAAGVQELRDLVRANALEEMWLFMSWQDKESGQLRHSWIEVGIDEQAGTVAVELVFLTSLLAAWSQKGEIISASLYHIHPVAPGQADNPNRVNPPSTADLRSFFERQKWFHNLYPDLPAVQEKIVSDQGVWQVISRNEIAQIQPDAWQESVAFADACFAYSASQKWSDVPERFRTAVQERFAAHTDDWYQRVVSFYDTPQFKVEFFPFAQTRVTSDPIVREPAPSSQTSENPDDDWWPE